MREFLIKEPHNTGGSSEKYDDDPIYCPLVEVIKKVN
jgi:hypothetical protein